VLWLTVELFQHYKFSIPFGFAMGFIIIASCITIRILVGRAMHAMYERHYGEESEDKRSLTSRMNPLAMAQRRRKKGKKDEDK